MSACPVMSDLNRHLAVVEREEAMDALVAAKLDDWLKALDLTNALAKSARSALEELAEQAVEHDIEQNRADAQGAE